MSMNVAINAVSSFLQKFKTLSVTFVQNLMLHQQICGIKYQLLTLSQQIKTTV